MIWYYAHARRADIAAVEVRRVAAELALWREVDADGDLHLGRDVFRRHWSRLGRDWNRMADWLAAGCPDARGGRPLAGLVLDGRRVGSFTALLIERAAGTPGRRPLPVYCWTRQGKMRRVVAVEPSTGADRSCVGVVRTAPLLPMTGRGGDD